jgi:cytochrome P450
MSTKVIVQGDPAKASVKDTFAVIADVVLPTLAKGVLIRRPRVVRLSERLGLDTRAVKRLQRLRAIYGKGPLLLSIPFRPQAIVLSSEHVHHILPDVELFAPATLEKRSALAHFEPNVSLASRPPDRAERRRFNDDVLESDTCIHSMAENFSAIVNDEVAGLLAEVGEGLSWAPFTTAWHRVVRRLILGYGARNDDELTQMLATLRSAGNWAFLHPGRRRLRDSFRKRLRSHLERAEAGSLAGRVTTRANSESTAVSDQVTQWLFAFDAAGMATFRTLALIAAHPGAQRRIHREISSGDPGRGTDLSFVRACLLEALRLWPTTPVILRETTRETYWGGRALPAGTHLVIYLPYFHRDDENLAYAHRFTPELWLSANLRGSWPLISFSEGPGVCPGRQLVLLVGCAMMAAILRKHEIKLNETSRIPDGPLPGALDQSTLSFSVRARVSMSLEKMEHYRSV